MTSRISRQECHQLATLARLSLDDAEQERFAAELGTILEYIEQLRAVDTEGIVEYLPPTRPGSALRRDAAGPCLDRDRALAGVVGDHEPSDPRGLRQRAAAQLQARTHPQRRLGAQRHDQRGHEPQVTAQL
ncbi:MAG: Asp-tRNA(Asn)/Glu-tRNA(Gln) amidotransferase subunit GatC [Myxococcales bacterium]|nr:Asp-tRNA(Asn)/Glu-tRNA(Gln) amidotransferase subunit GatC [Myxococcales bacterium]